MTTLPFLRTQRTVVDRIRVFMGTDPIVEETGGRRQEWRRQEWRRQEAEEQEAGDRSQDTGDGRAGPAVGMAPRGCGGLICGLPGRNPDILLTFTSAFGGGEGRSH